MRRGPASIRVVELGGNRTPRPPKATVTIRHHARAHGGQGHRSRRIAASALVRRVVCSPRASAPVALVHTQRISASEAHLGDSTCSGPR